MQSIVEGICVKYPRLHLLTIHEVLKVISAAPSSTTLLSVIRKMYPSISRLVTTEGKLQSDMDPVLVNEKELQIVAVEDCIGEQLMLSMPVSSTCKKNVEWLEALDRAMRYSLSCQLTYSRSTLPPLLQGNEVEERGLCVF